MEKIKNIFKNLSEDQLRKVKVFSVAGIVLIVLSAIVYFAFFNGEEEEITEIEIPKAKQVTQYNNKLDAVSRKNQNENYQDNVNQYFQNVDLTKGMDQEDIYNEETAKMDSLIKVFDKENKANDKPKKAYKVRNDSERTAAQTIVQTKTESVKEKELTEEEKRLLFREKRRKELTQGSSGGKDNLPKSFSASIRGTQTLKSGQLLTLVSNTELVVNGLSIPKNTNLYGQISFQNNKAECSIRSINLNNQVIPCNLHVYSSNGTKGIDIDIDPNINRGRNNAISEGASEISSGYGKAIGILTDVARGKAQEVKITFTDNQKVIIVSNEK